MAQFIAIARRSYDRFAESDFTPELMDAEAAQAARLYAEGVFRSIWSHGSPAGAVLLMEADSREAAEAALETLPLKARGMLEIEVLSIRGYRGFCPPG